MVRWTGEMMREFVESEGYQLISVPNEDWVKSLDRIVVSCGSHEPYEVTRKHFRRGVRCAKCSGQYRYNHDEIKEEIKKLDENYFVCDDSPIYENANTKLKLSCGKHFYFASWSKFMSNRRCPKCANEKRSEDKKFRHDDIFEKIEELGLKNTLCEDSPKYKNSQTKLKFLCENNHYFMMSWNNIQQGQSCSICAGNQNLTHNEVCERIERLNKGYKVLQDSPLYKRWNTKLKISCRNDHYFMASWNSLQQGNGCPECYGKLKYTHQEICEEVSKLDSEYSVCSDSPLYENAKTKLKLYHSVCKNEFDITWANFKQDSKPCGCYTSSKNEILLRGYLKSRNIKFSEQVTFDDLVSDKERKLRYDFGIYENNEITILIEYDGEQHFKPVEYFGGQEQFEKQQHHDKLKNDYAKENNIPLLRIRYDEDTISVLENYLKDLQLIKEDDIINLTKEKID